VIPRLSGESVFEKWLRFFISSATFQVHPRPFLISHELAHHIVERPAKLAYKFHSGTLQLMTTHLPSPRR
jgi:hypothetical protein